MTAESQRKYQAAKLAVMLDVRRVEKSRRMQGAGSYQYAGAEEVIADLRPRLVQEGITVSPAKSEMILQDRIELAGGKKMVHTVMKVTYRFSHLDGGGEDVETLGEAADNLDKSCNKCMTAALKYALLQTFLLQGSHDDPDDYPSHEQASDHKPEPQKPVQQPAPRQANGVRQETDRVKALKATAKQTINSMPPEKIGADYKPFLDSAVAEAKDMQLSEQESGSYLNGVLCYWFMRRLDFVQTPLDGNKVEKLLDASPVLVASKEYIKNALRDRIKLVTA